MEWNEESLTLLIQNHIPAVRRVLRHFTNDPEELKDLEQETFLRAMVFLPSLRDPNRFRPWVTAIARNVALGQLRAAKRERINLEQLSEPPEPFEAEQVAEAGLVEYAMRQLPSNIGQTMRLFYFEDLDGRTIAKRLGISEANVRQRLSRGRKKLREVILDMARKDEEMAEMLVQRLLDTAKSLTVQGKYQDAVEKFLEAFNTFPGPLTALTQLPEDLREALKEAWGHAYQYRPPEEVAEPEGAADWSAYADLLEEIPKEERWVLIGTIEDIARWLQVSPAWIYIWWKQGMPHRKEGDTEIIRFNLALVKQWIEKNDIKMPPKMPPAESYFLVKGIVYGLREGILSPEDVEVMVETFVDREQTALYRRGSFFCLREVGQGGPPEVQEALTQCTRLLTDAHQLAVRLRETYTPNCGYTGPYPYDRETGCRIADKLRQMAVTLGESEQHLNTAATALDRLE